MDRIINEIMRGTTRVGEICHEKDEEYAGKRMMDMDVEGRRRK